MVKNGIEMDSRDIFSLEKTIASHPECPGCHLPTSKDGEGLYQCASCEETFELSKRGLTPHKLHDKKKGPILPIVISSLILILLIFGSIGVALYFHEGNEELINIHDISGIRGLEAAREVPVQYMAPTYYDDHIRTGLDDRARREIRELESFYQCMLVMDPDWDLLSLAENTSSSNVVAFYDSDTESITILEDSNSRVYLNYILSHEFTHALQDQNFDLDIYYPSGSFDQDLARLSVIEGDAMLTMELWTRESLGLYERMKLNNEMTLEPFRSGAYYELERSNRIISNINYFPYREGQDFIEKIHEKDGYEGVNELFKERPPLSTEQILHFEKYLSMEEPDRIDLDLQRIDMEVAFESCAGEKILTELLPDLAGSIHELKKEGSDIGWGGDRFVYLENGTEFLSIFAIQWDTERINDIFHMMFRDMMSLKGNGFRENSTMIDGHHMNIFKDGRMTYVLRSNSNHLIGNVLEIL